MGIPELLFLFLDLPPLWAGALGTMYSFSQSIRQSLIRFSKPQWDNQQNGSNCLLAHQLPHECGQNLGHSAWMEVSTESR